MTWRYVSACAVVPGDFLCHQIGIVISIEPIEHNCRRVVVLQSNGSLLEEVWVQQYVALVLNMG
jgi:hypothetical protein